MLKIKSLLGHGQVETACLCLSSLLRYSRQPGQLTLHDDGSLTPEDRKKLHEALGDFHLIERNEADAIVDGLLEKYPACQSYRRESPFGLKLFDVALLQEKSEPQIFCDSDVLFLRPFNFPHFKETQSVIFMEDSHQCFALRPWNIHPFGPIRIINKANTGFTIMGPNIIDLDYVESLLSDHRLQAMFAKHPGWVEQTCWAAMAGRHPAYMFDPLQIMMAGLNRDAYSLKPVGIHFVSTYRNQLQDFAGLPSNQALEAETLRYSRAANASALAVFLDKMGGRLTEIALNSRWNPRLAHLSGK